MINVVTPVKAYQQVRVI